MAISRPPDIPELPRDAEDQGFKPQLDEIRFKKEAAEKLHSPLRKMWEEQYGLYRNYRRLGGTARYGREPDRDQVAEDKREWGAELFIPYAYATVETVLPRIVANDPAMLVRPSGEEGREAARSVKRLLEKQQRDMSYDQKLQEVAKRGCVFGLGIQKTYWKKDSKQVRVNKKATVWNRIVNPSGIVTGEEEKVFFDGPYAEPVNNFDFFWDPAAKDIETANWVLHRTWRDYGYVENKIRQGPENGGWFPVDLEVVRGNGSAKWAEARQGLNEAAGYGSSSTSDAGDLHEVWEFWTRDKVITVLDNTFVVWQGENPCYHNEIPFQIFRPSLDPAGNFCGIGLIEPIKHLIYELNTLRGQRRDNATIVLNKMFAVTEGMVEEDQLRSEPGGIIKTIGPPGDVLMPINFGDIPNSGYQEAQEIKSDLELTTGMSDAVAGSGGASGTAGSETATGIQLIQGAANIRIRQMSKNLERETIRPACRQIMALNRQHTLSPRTIRVEDPAAQDGYAFHQVGPDELGGVEDVEPDAGSTEPYNEVAQEQKASTLLTALTGNPEINQRELLTHYMRENGVSDPERFLANPETVPVNIPMLGEQLVGGIAASLMSNGTIKEGDTASIDAVEQMVTELLDMAMQEQAEGPKNELLTPPDEPEGPPPEEAQE